MGSKLVEKTTMNSSVYNKAHKQVLEDYREISCAYCSYHKGENFRGATYGGYGDQKNVKMPSWKLTSKNRKQWQDKGVNITETEGRSWYRNNHTYIKVEFKRNKNRYY